MTALFSMRIESFPFSKTTFILPELNVGRSLLITLKEAQQACLSLTEHTQRQSHKLVQFARNISEASAYSLTYMHTSLTCSFQKL